MEQVKLSNDVSVSRIIAGFMRADAKSEEAETLEFVHQCLEQGINTFDHAPVYGAYTIEKLFGDRVLRKEPGLRSHIKIITKAGIVLPNTVGNKHIYYDSRKESLLNEIDRSLMKLATDHVDVLLIHRPDILGDPAETAEALEEIIKSGKALTVGVSNYEPAQFSALQSKLPFKLVANQMEFSVKSTYNFFNGVIDQAFELRTPIMVWSPLGGGSVFTGTDEQSIRLRKVLSEIAEAHCCSVDMIMYAFLLVHPAKLMPITGTMNIARVKNAVDALDIKLSYDEWYSILAASRGYDVP